jgi:Mg/Co/Ni transporter MgtE
MATDDAADLIADLDQDRRGRVLALLPPARQRQIKALLGYNPSTAGGLMSPDILTVSHTATVADGLRRVSESAAAPETLTTIYLVDEAGTLVGSVPIVTLMRTNATTPVQQVAEREPECVHPDADLPEVARLMTDYNLVMLPVVDDHGRAIGVVTVDDVLELTLPTGWRRRYGLVRD